MKGNFPSVGIFMLIILLTGCVERYYPEEDELKTGTLVINAHLTDRTGMQHMEISRSSTLLYSEYDPLPDCFAELVREDGMSRKFTDRGNGDYQIPVDRELMKTGMSYRLHVITPEGNEYESDFETLRPVPQIDSLYYRFERHFIGADEDEQDGIRFYLDFTYDSDQYRYIRWELVETYEFHNPSLEPYIYDVDRRLKPLPDTSAPRICWITNPLYSIHSMSLTYLDQGTYIKKPLNYVPNIQQEQKLHHKYSLLVRQYSLSAEAFHYWNELKKTTQEMGSLFGMQPALLESNICNVSEETERVLGFFSISGVTEKRVFAEDVEGIDTTPYKWYCFPVPRLGGMGWRSTSSLPIYFARGWMDGQSVFAQVNKHCVDCRAYRNSTHIRPGFW
jgi:hypothetical protein